MKQGTNIVTQIDWMFHDKHIRNFDLCEGNRIVLDRGTICRVEKPDRFRTLISTRHLSKWWWAWINTEHITKSSVPSVPSV